MTIHPELNDNNFTQTYERHTAHIRGVLTNRGCPSNLLDDLCQDVWTRVWTKRHLFDPAKSPLKTWLAVVAERVWFKQYKSLSGEPETLSISQLADRGDNPLDESDFYPATPSPETEMNLKIDINNVLKPTERELLKMDLEGLTHKEIGTKLGVTPAAVRSRLARLRDKLRFSGVYKDDTNE